MIILHKYNILIKNFNIPNKKILKYKENWIYKKLLKLNKLNNIINK